jgi:glucose-6-phosphate isomerase
MKTVWNLGPITLDISALWDKPKSPSPSDASKDRLKTFDHQMRERFRSGTVGFYDLPVKPGSHDPECVLAAAQKIKKEFQAALVLGIGGSYLGAASVVQALGHSDFPLTWVSNIDPAAIRQAKALLAARKHATLIVSKSGNTTETLAALYHLSPELDPKGFLAITDPQSGELRQLSQQQGWASMEVPPNVGGRFSVLTPVGLLPACLAGVDIVGLMRGAQTMRTLLESAPLEENPAYLFATALHSWDLKGHSLQYLMPYWSSLRSFAEWYVQLWGESLGKKTPSGTRVGPTPVAALGTTDQHSLLQLFNEGPSNKVVGFIDVGSQGERIPVGEAAFPTLGTSYLCKHDFETISHEALVATRRSLTNSGVPTYTLTVESLNAEAMGALIFFFETATAFAGELYGVNAFDQPGVEETKKLLHAALR